MKKEAPEICSLTQHDVSQHSIQLLRLELQVVKSYLDSRSCQTDNNDARRFVDACLLLLENASIFTDRKLAAFNYEVVRSKSAALRASTNGLLLNIATQASVNSPERGLR